MKTTKRAREILESDAPELHEDRSLMIYPPGEDAG